MSKKRKKRKKSKGTPVAAVTKKKVKKHKVRTNVMKAFANEATRHKRIGRKELIAKVVAATGCYTWTVDNYIALAKKEGGKTFDFRLKETENEKGERVLSRIK